MTATTAQYLARKIEERQKFIEKVVGFVEPLLMHVGRRNLYEERDDHIIAQIELSYFHGFSFYFGCSRRGEVKIWQHLDAPPYAMQKLLEVEWDMGAIDRCRVSHYHSIVNWQWTFEGFMGVGWEALAEQHKQEQAGFARRNQLARERTDEEREEQDRVRREAKRLKLV